MANVSIFCFLASYVVAFVLEWLRLFRRSSVNRVVMLLFAAAGFFAHTWYLWIRSQKFDLPPLLSSTQDWMLVLAWVAVLLYLFLTTVDRELAIGLFLLPLVLLLVAATYLVSGEPSALLSGATPEQAAMRGWVMLHASLLVFGIAGVLLGLVLSMMYLVQHRRLKHKQTLHEGIALPSLARLARLNRWSIVIAVPLLTLGMLSGVWLGLRSDKQPVEISFFDPVIISNGVVWLAMMALFVWLIRHPKSGGRELALLTAWACGFLLATLIGLQILAGGGMPSWHS